ncbi:MAG TPA: dTDP-glucose 4,6-dehydratase [Candidatus Paceibacterota bacterium]|nr:dTDP-glucose 4,6-dehydratase [Candidatus Paceibacterota bacterium]
MTARKTILVTGGCGFIGSHFIRHWLARHRRDRVVNLDTLTYAGLRANIADAAGNRRYAFVKADIADARAVGRALASYRPTHLVNFAAETHVDRSVHGGAADFVRTNVQGVQTLLEAVRTSGMHAVFVSTDEVYGSLPLRGGRPFRENTPLDPRSPYAASKAAGDVLVRAYHETYGIRACVTRCSNNYGPNQYPEKLIPFMTLRALAGKPLPLYGDGRNVRDWIHVTDHVRAVERVLLRGKAGAVYNIGADCERSNIRIAHDILHTLGKPRSLVTFVADRPGHDRRYAMDAAHIGKSLGWKCREKYGIMLPRTVRWYADNPGWVRKALARVRTVNPHIPL